MNAVEVLSVLGIGLVAALLCVVLRPQRPEFALVLSLTVGVLILSQLVFSIEKISQEISSLLTATNISQENIKILLKCLGICLLTQLGCEAARDAGECAVASKIEMAGKLMILAASLPLFSQILRIVSRLL